MSPVCLHDCLQYFTAPCELYDFRCPKCDSGSGNVATKQILPDRLPKCLLIAFVRWKNIQNKNDEPPIWEKDPRNVNYTETMDVTPILTEEGAMENDPKFTLCGVLEHEGSVDAGHYTNLHVGHSQIFGTVDKITRMSVAKVQSKFAYMLLYCVRDDTMPCLSRPYGLSNVVGNRCWFNAVMQLLWCGPCITPGEIACQENAEPPRDYDEGWFITSKRYHFRWLFPNQKKRRRDGESENMFQPTPSQETEASVFSF